MISLFSSKDLVNSGALVSLSNKDGDTPLDKTSPEIAKGLRGKFYDKGLTFSFGGGPKFTKSRSQKIATSPM